MCRIPLSIVATIAVVCCCAARAQSPAPAAIPNPFYAFDNSFQHADLTHEQQLDLLKELGYAGVAWHEQAPEAAMTAVKDCEARGLKMFTIYCPAKVTPGGELTHSPTLLALIKALEGHGTLIWVHIGGKGPAFDSLTGNEPLFKTLRDLADAAAAAGLRVAIYPHLGEWTAHFGDATKVAKLVNHKSFGVTFNLCHCLATGDEQQIPALLSEAKDLLFSVSICGADSGVTGGKWGQLIQPLDRGTFDTAALLKQLHGIGYTGPIGFQGYGIKLPTREILVPTMQAWRKLSGQ